MVRIVEVVVLLACICACNAKVWQVNNADMLVAVVNHKMDTGDVVIIAPGDYNLATYLEVNKANVIIQGAQGQHKTNLYFGAEMVYAIHVAPVANVTIQDITVRNGPVGFVVEGEHSVLERVRVLNAECGIFTYSKGFTVIQSHMFNCSEGVRTRQLSSGSIIDSSISMSTFGINLSEGNLKVVGTSFINNGQAVIAQTSAGFLEVVASKFQENKKIGTVNSQDIETMLAQDPNGLTFTCDFSLKENNTCYLGAKKSDDSASSSDSDIPVPPVIPPNATPSSEDSSDDSEECGAGVWIVDFVGNVMLSGFWSLFKEALMVLCCPNCR